jgi:hypothetical protein
MDPDFNLVKVFVQPVFIRQKRKSTGKTVTNSKDPWVEYVVRLAGR